MLNRTTLVLAGFLSLISASANALTINTGTGGLDASQQVQSIDEPVNDMPNTNWRTGTYGPQHNTMPQGFDTTVLPYGTQLFTGGFRGTRSDGFNPDYKVAPGDLITLRLWGAVEIERALPVDAKGYIFIPTVGPVSVQGTSLQALNSRVKAAVLTVYPENVNVYTNLQGTQPVAVFVTGQVENPGRYAGTPNDSVLYFLDQAGGIDDQLGSFRQVRVLRNGKTIVTVDLYSFLKNGVMPRVQFRDGDTVVVDQRQSAVLVSGEVERDYLYELNLSETDGGHLLRYAPTKPGITHVLVRGIRGEGLFSKYYTLNEFKTAQLNDGDEVLFSADRREDTIVVQVEGSYYGPSRYAIPNDATLTSLLDNISVPQHLTETRSISIRRESVAERQRQSLMESLRRLETTYLGASSSTPEEAEIRVKEAELISQFIEKASKAEPTGRMVVANNGKIADIRLQDGDIITIPEATDSLLVSGEVLIPQAVVYTPGDNVNDYVERSGGFTQHADDENILVVRLNGEVLKASDARLQPGDEILVLPHVPTKNLQLATSLTQIVYQLAIATKVALDL
ncbi:polysaccharide biosynthesis/export family protein [Neptunomonas phycophila]|uniref:Polysaccharide biosynthesis/export family protein n=1 Tax=Neptunomonas phycophila TaxID=1572645 RepID=A0AAW7XNM8_9GAMM|nr:polysaccharide biosynthesis/export family protein [Neptunomonas phycophila]MDO6455356.1 polysaccharide biosynthesis/export family protein [Neptunomonas phycophila]